MLRSQPRNCRLENILPHDTNHLNMNKNQMPFESNDFPYYEQ